MPANVENDMMTKKTFPRLFLGLFLVLAGLLAQRFSVAAYEKPTPAPTPLKTALHPTFTLLDADGQNVLKSGKPLSTMTTCGQCHDTDYIADHNFHADLGLRDYHPTDALNASPGVFGKWDPLTYRYLSQPGDERLDLSTAEWLMTVGLRHVGGGPAMTSRAGNPLTGLVPSATNPESALLTPDGSVQPWDWEKSGVIEINCFLCHMAQPDVAARQKAIQNGRFAWANTATLQASGLVQSTADGWQWNPAAFDENGQLKADHIIAEETTNENCVICHGVADRHSTALVITDLSLANPQTATTGQVISPQKISESGMNISDKMHLSRSWDVHAERQVACTDCHFSLNNPVYVLRYMLRQEELSHLTFDQRRLDVGAYLTKPDHNFARGQSAQYTVAPELKGTMRRCESCHDATSAHQNWLPYIDKHMSTLACESCHIPQLYAPAIEQYDWTVLTSDGQPRKVYRGIAGGSSDTVTTLVTGYQPVLLPRRNIDGQTKWAPYNLITTWYWLYEDANGNQRPVRTVDLQAAWFDGNTYAPNVLAVFDANSDGNLDDTELRIDSDQKEQVIAGRLSALGLKNVHIEGLIQPYSLNHSVARGEWAVNDCTTCHHQDSRLTTGLQVAEYTPAGAATPHFAETNVMPQGTLQSDANGALVFTPDLQAEGLYIFGSSRISWLDRLGALAFLATLLAIIGHATMRFLAARRQPKEAAPTKKVYMYMVYERFWHWLQAMAIFILLLTGLVIHRPDMFGAFSFRHMVAIHNVVAAILVINAVLSLFYHLATGEIQQYIPRPATFIDHAIMQATFYLKGIFQGKRHPFEKVPTKKLNPLQQVTYLGLLNVLLPLQVITGSMIWGAQRWPEITAALGGLLWLAPVHSLVAWLLATFIVAHVYMTTTGPTILTDIEAMITGWEDVEVHTPQQP